MICILNVQQLKIVCIYVPHKAEYRILNQGERSSLYVPNVLHYAVLLHSNISSCFIDVY
jgi:hypothetical protein